MKFSSPLDVVVVGGGMITELQLLPSIYHLQRLGAVSDISVCALNAAPLKKLVSNEILKNAFPDQTFTPYPELEKKDQNKTYPDLYKEVIGRLEPRNIVVIALPDQMHFEAIMHTLNHDQHVLCVKPLTLTYRQAEEIKTVAHERGLFVGVEYHKRFDYRVDIARRKYRAGDFGEFKLGMAALIEPWYYRDSNFQNWCTTDHTDMFTYIGCHYVDLVYMITGLLPVQVSVYGIVETYPNGNKGYLWTQGRVIWENGACLSVMNGMGYPDVGPGGNFQGLWLFTQGKEDGGVLLHDDQYRGIKHGYITKGTTPGDVYYNEPNPDYFKLIERGGGGLEPVGYGYRSIQAIVEAIHRVEQYVEGMEGEQNLRKRQEMIRKIDDEGIVATPANSAFNELVIEAGRMSILNEGRDVVIEYGDRPNIRFKEISKHSA